MAFASIGLAQTQLRPRELLRNDPDETPRKLAEAIDRGSLQETVFYATELVQAGRPQLVINCINDPSDIAKQGLSMALAATKQYQALPPLIELYEQMLTTTVRGGDEGQIMRSETLQVVETGLVQLTGIAIDPKWTPAEKIVEFRKQIEGNNNKVPDRHNSGTKLTPAPLSSQQPQQEKATETKPTLPTSSKEPPSSTSWGTIVVLIVAACGLLWLLLKRRL